MGFISGYPKDSNISLSDKLIGTDAENALATKNFEIGDFITFVGNNLPTKENIANKSTNTGLGGNTPSDILYPTQKAVKTYTDSAIGDAVFDINQELADKENIANKSTNVTTDGASNTKYPSVKAVKDYVDANIGGTSVVKSVKVSLSSSQILNLFTTPIEVVPAVSGKVLILRQIFQKYTHVSTAYTVAGNFRIGLGDPNFAPVSFSASIQSADNSESLNPIAPSSSTSGGTYINLPLVLGCLTSNPTGGDGTLDLYITYFEITI